MNNENEKKVVEITTNKVEENIEKINPTEEKIENEISKKSSKKWLMIALFLAALAIVGYFLSKSSVKTNLDTKNVTFNKIGESYAKASGKAMSEKGSGNITFTAKDFGEKNKKERFTGDFNDVMKYSADVDLKNKKINIDLKQKFSFSGSEKNSTTPDIKIKDIPFDFKILVNNEKIYFKVNTDVKKIVSAAKENDPKNNGVNMMAEMSKMYLDKYFALDLTKIPGYDEKGAKEYDEIFSTKLMNEQMAIFNNYNKKYKAFSLKATGKTSTINGYAATEFQIKAGETENVVKFFQDVVNNAPMIDSYTEEQQKAIEKDMEVVNKNIEEFFADKKRSAAFDKILKDNIDSKFLVWLSNDLLPVRSTVDLEIKNISQMVNELQKISNIDKESVNNKTIELQGDANLKINFTEDIKYDQKIDIQYPAEKDTMDLMAILNGMIGTAGLPQ